VRPNNVDIAYGVMLGGTKIDVAVVTERYAHRLRVYRLPDMAPVDRGGIPVFPGELARDCMGIALYTRPGDGALFAIVSRSDYQAPLQGYLHQYRLVDDGTGVLKGVFVRSFGTWSGRKDVVVSNQQDNSFNFYPREGETGNPHTHPLLKRVDVSTIESDGSDVTHTALPGFPGGLFVAMSNGRVFHFYAWNDLAAAARPPVAGPTVK